MGLTPSQGTPKLGRAEAEVVRAASLPHSIAENAIEGATRPSSPPFHLFQRIRVRLPGLGYLNADFPEIPSIGSVKETGSMPKVSVYIRPTTGKRTPKKATKGSTGPFYLRYEIDGKRVWESLQTRTYTFALAAARN